MLKLKHNIEGCATEDTKLAPGQGCVAWQRTLDFCLSFAETNQRSCNYGTFSLRTFGAEVLFSEWYVPGPGEF